MDEFIDNLLRLERYCDVILPRLQKREVLEEANDIAPRVSILEDDLDEMASDSDEEEEEGEMKEAATAIGDPSSDRKRTRERSRSRERRRRHRDGVLHAMLSTYTISTEKAQKICCKFYSLIFFLSDNLREGTMD